MTAMHSIALFAAAVLACLALSARLGAVSGGVHIPHCPTVTSLQELPDMQACRQVLAMAKDPLQGCAAHGSLLPNTNNPTGGYVRICGIVTCVAARLSLRSAYMVFRCGTTT
jgi:hypothetical protein